MAKASDVAKDKIFEAIKELGGLASAREISDKSNYSLQFTQRILRHSVDDGKLIKQYGRNGRNSYDYRINPKYFEIENETREIKEAENSIQAGQLLTLMQRWSNEQWVPRLIKTAPNLPIALALYYKYSAQVAQGEVISQYAYGELLAMLNEFRVDLQNAYTTVSSILSTAELRTPESSVEFLIQNYDPELIIQLANSVIQANS